MGLGIVVIFYLLVSGALFVCAAVVCWIVGLLLRGRHRWLRPWLMAAPVLVGAAPTALLVAGLLWANLAPPSVRFHDVFDAWPGQGVRDLKAHSVGTNDAEWIDLAFAADEATSASLVRPPFRKIEDAREIANVLPLAGDGPPPWWTAHRCPNREVHLARHLRAWDEVIVTRCWTDGRVYVQARWID
ncbi:hypothetical protein OVA11_01780 [Caulobacter sp. SL161]|uniref:hypothetical protein n=1 Tax=Caulobacter sp. SL161 TaxID=2995156 RepID=UPI002275D05F|nr:hypothetical protein [Caulobacter sp. SL161]MCY1645832.1 hypothetical protein [Caulobacter sp. SL161]